MFFSLFVIQAVYSLLLCVGFTADVFQSICYLGCLQSVVLYWFYSLHFAVYLLFRFFTVLLFCICFQTDVLQSVYNLGCL